MNAIKHFNKAMLPKFKKSLYSSGTFLLWMSVFYYLSSAAARRIISTCIMIYAGAALVDYMFFGKDYGNMSPMLQYDDFKSAVGVDYLINGAVILAAALLLTLIRNRWPAVIRSVSVAACAAIAIMSCMNIVSIQRNMDFCRSGGYAGFLTPFVWMFIRKYEPARREIIDNSGIVTLIQFEYSAYEEATVPLCAFVLVNDRRDAPGGYFRLTGFRGGMDVQRRKAEEALLDPDGCGYFYRVSQREFDAIPSSPIAYWAGEKIRSVFRSAPALGEIALARNGMKTGDNARFLRLWWEVDPGRLKTDCRDCEEAKASGAKCPAVSPRPE